MSDILLPDEHNRRLMRLFNGVSSDKAEASEDVIAISRHNAAQRAEIERLSAIIRKAVPGLSIARDFWTGDAAAPFTSRMLNQALEVLQQT